MAIAELARTKMKHRLIVAIDGPAGAGKSSIAKIVAHELGYLYIDTGAMYRAITWKALQRHLNIHDGDALTRLAKETEIELKPDAKGSALRVFVDGEEVTPEIRSENVSLHTNAIAAVQGIRKILRDKQRAMGKKGGVVMEGRDIGTSVFPHADVKFYLDASPTERAERRYKELKAKGKKVNLERIAHALAQRDYLDKNRGISPLKQAKDAIVIDSTDLSLEEAAQKMINHIGFIVNQKGRAL